jgi:hypothetical protein
MLPFVAVVEQSREFCSQFYGNGSLTVVRPQSFEHKVHVVVDVQLVAVPKTHG